MVTTKKIQTLLFFISNCVGFFTLFPGFVVAGSSPEVYSAVDTKEGTAPAAAAVEEEEQAASKVHEHKKPLKKLGRKSLPRDVLSSRNKKPATQCAQARAEIQDLKEELVELRKQSLPVQKLSQFESVPEKYVDSIAGRLRLVEEILRTSGRAYDYRSATTEELEKILQKNLVENSPRSRQAE